MKIKFKNLDVNKFAINKFISYIYHNECMTCENNEMHIVVNHMHNNKLDPLGAQSKSMILRIYDDKNNCISHLDEDYYPSSLSLRVKDNKTEYTLILKKRGY